VKQLLIALLAIRCFGAEEFDVVYRKVDGLELRLDAAFPDTAGPHPVILCLHGGGWNMGSRRAFHKFMREFVAAGYATVSMQYRLSTQAKFPAQLEDIREAVNFVKSNATRFHADPDKFVLMGGSAGAHLALLAGLSGTVGETSIRAIVDLSGPTDLRDWRMSEGADQALRKTTGKSSEDLVTLLLGTEERSGALVESASPVMRVGPKSPPVLVIHWKEDQAVNRVQAERLLKELAKAKVRHEVIWLEGRGHAFNGPGVESVVPNSIAFLKTLPALR
jgi:acetyl esterase/lipase